MTARSPVITFDGPSGVGKGTISRLLAKQLGWHYLDSGAVYRALALWVRQTDRDLTDPDQWVDEAYQLPLRFDIQANTTRLYLAGEEISRAIRTEQCGQDASYIAQFPAVRLALLAAQQAFKQPPGLVADGRDMGTVVFPTAMIKFYLEATPEIRAKRRSDQLNRKGIHVSLASILSAINERDKRDSERDMSPLCSAADAVLIDTSLFSVKEVFQTVLLQVQACLGG